MGCNLNRPTLERLMQYYHYITEHLHPHPPDSANVSSVQIAELLGIDPAQVRKDLAAINVKGQPNVGYKISTVVESIRQCLGFDKNYNAVLIGAGRLGGAIACYDEFRFYGLKIAALLDNAPQKIGTMIDGHKVQSVEMLEDIVQQQNIKLAILTVPAEAAQKLAERVTAAGIETIWNFSPTSLVMPDNVIVRNEHLSVGLAQLFYHLARRT